MAFEMLGELERELQALTEAGLRRELPTPEPAGPRDFTSNDYLGLRNHPAVREAAAEAALAHGAGAGAARLLGGGSPLDAALEREVAAWLQGEAALLFPSGYQANLGLLTALAPAGTQIYSDRLNHASLIDGARLAGGRVHVFEHKNLEQLEQLLHRDAHAKRRIVLAESVYSMDGDAAPLVQLAELCERHTAGLIVDEAHAAGVLGPEGGGGWLDAGLPGDAQVLLARLVTGGKSLGASGGLVVSSRIVRDLLLHRARGFVFTTGVAPATVGALRKAVELCREADDRRDAVRRHARRLAARFDLPEPAAAIVPISVGGAARATMEAAAQLREQGFDVRGVRPPTVPEGSSRLRVVCHSYNTDESVDALGRALLTAREAVPAAVSSAPTEATTHNLIVAGTDTEIGKTVVSALLVRAAAARGAVRYWKPVQTGPDDDTAEVRRLVQDTRAEFSKPTYHLARPASPHHAAADEAVQGVTRTVQADFARHASWRDDSRQVIELAGGLLVPYELDFTQADLLEELGWPVVLVARSSLGTLNHTLLSLEALRRRRVPVRALFLVGEPHPDNRETLEALSGVEQVHVLPRLPEVTGTALAEWLHEHLLPDLWASS